MNSNPYGRKNQHAIKIMTLPDIKACGHRNIERNCSSVLLTYKCKDIKGDSNS